MNSCVGLSDTRRLLWFTQEDSVVYQSVITCIFIGCDKGCAEVEYSGKKMFVLWCWK